MRRDASRATPSRKCVQVHDGSGNELRYTGREDDGTGVYYYRARYYHPGLQRFISEDPIGFAGGDANLYNYVFNEPTSLRDPTGLAVDPISWTAAAIMCGSGSVIGAVMAGRKATWDERLHYAGVGCAAGMLTLVSWVAAGGVAIAGTAGDLAGVMGAVGSAASQAAIKFDWSRAVHIFGGRAGHVNPTTLASQQRFARLFEAVASNPNNARADFPLTPQHASAGLQAFTQVFRNGEQVWVLVRAGQIVNAGVNSPGAHY